MIPFDTNFTTSETMFTPQFTVSQVDFSAEFTTDTDFTTEFVSSDISFSTEFGTDTVSFNSDFGAVKVITDAEVYDGSYDVIPDFTKQTLSTKDKLLIADVTVEKIPLWVVENVSGGNTVIIGGEFDNG